MRAKASAAYVELGNQFLVEVNTRLQRQRPPAPALTKAQEGVVFDRMKVLWERMHKAVDAAALGCALPPEDGE